MYSKAFASRGLRISVGLFLVLLVAILLWVFSSGGNRSSIVATSAELPDGGEPPQSVTSPAPSVYLNAAGQPLPFVADQVLVKFADAATEDQVSTAITSVGATINETFVNRNNLYLLNLPAGIGPARAIEQLASLDVVEESEPNFIYQKDVVPDDYWFHAQWGLHNDGKFGLADVDIDAPEAWEFTTGSANVYIGILDTGIEYSNEDLIDNVWTNPGEIPGNGIDDDQNGWVDDIHGIDVVNNDSDPADDDDHGTQVAGIIAARGNNSIGIAGVLWRAQIISCKFLDNEGYGTTAGAITCLNYFSDLKDAGVDVVATNNSWGGTNNSNQLSNAIQDHLDRQILFVASAGNDGVDTDFSPHYPSGFNLTNIISVAAIDIDGELAEFSNFGLTTVDFAAPGVGVLTTKGVASYDGFTGTSAAAPFVTGIIGLAKANDESLSGNEIRSWLMSNGKPLDSLAGRVSTGTLARAKLRAPDSDEDGMPNSWELQFGLDPQNAADAALDADSDGVSNLDEFLLGSDPTDTDSDDDGLSDGDEVNIYQSDPTSADSDGDGLGDFDEVNLYGTNPASVDTDADGLNDREELDTYSTNPLLADSDGDGLDDGWEVRFGFDPTQAGDQDLDSDADGLSNGAEFLAGTNPFIIDSDEDGVIDGDEVSIYGTDPASNDSDGDGIPDGWEIRYGLDPLNAADAALDLDGDGLSNLEEYENGDDPTSVAAATLATPWSNPHGTSRQAAHTGIETDVSDARLIWQAHLGEDPEFVIANGELAAIFKEDGPGLGKLSYFVGLDLLTGREKWRRLLVQQGPHSIKGLRNRLAIISAPSARANTVVVYDSGTGRPSSATVVTDNVERVLASVSDDDSIVSVTVNEMFTVDAATGAEVWRQSLSSYNATLNPPAMNESYVVHSSFGRVDIHLRSSGLRFGAIDSATCDVGPQPRIALDDANRAFVLGRCMLAIDMTSAQVIWELDGTDPGQLTVDESAVYVSVNGEFQALDPDSGELLWRLENQSFGGGVVSSATHLFSKSENGITAINKTTRAIEWSFPMLGELSLSDNGVLVVAGEYGVTAFDISADRDADGMRDNWERKHKLNYLDPNDGDNDNDNDGLTNRQELDAGADPGLRDSDGDGLADFEETTVYGTDASRADSDDDGLSDAAEILTHFTNPLRFDTDTDGFGDADEVERFGSNPVDAASQPDVLRRRLESFESGMPPDWVVPAGATIGWSVQPGSATDGQFSLVSDAVIDRETAIIEWSGYFLTGAVSFDIRKDAASNQAETQIWLDGEWIATLNGHEWEQYRILLEEGEHTIRWEFRNDSRDDSNLLYIDNVNFREAGPYASNTNHLLTTGTIPGGAGLIELDMQGEQQGPAISIPLVDVGIRAGIVDLVVTGDHKVIFGNAPILHVYDPLRKKFELRYLGQWKAREQRHIAAFEDRMFVASHGAFPGVLWLDTNGDFVDQVLDGINYIDLVAGLDGFMYGLQQSGGIIDRIAPDTQSIVGSITVDTRATRIAVDVDGTVVVTVPENLLLTYNANGGFVDSITVGDDEIEGGPVLNSKGDVFVAVDGSGIWESDADLMPPRFLGPGSSLLATVTRFGVDSDADGLPDWWEAARFLNPDDPGDAGIDRDGDGLTSLQEYQAQTDPNITDSDGDGLTDGDEVLVHNTNPLARDSDDDTLSDFDEIFVHATNPNAADSDADGLGDATELLLTNSDPLNPDSDGDGMPDGWEYSNGLNLNDAQDASGDPDSDGLSNLGEFNAGTNILLADTDNDGLNDGSEVANFTDPLNKDTDNDWLYDGWELQYGLDPLLANDTATDTDSDGFTDVDEFYQNTDPTVFGSRPLPGPWAMYQGNSSHTGYVPVSIDPEKLEVAWENNVMPGALHLSSLAIDADTVSVSIDDAFGSKSLVGLESSTGAERWSVDFGPIFNLSPPAAADNAIYVRTAAGADSALYKFDDVTGDELFRVVSSLSISSAAPRPLAPTVFADDVFIAYANSYVASHRTDTGVRNWDFGPQFEPYWAPAVNQDFVYVNSRNDLAVLDRLTGDPQYIIQNTVSAGSANPVHLPVLNRFGSVFEVQAARLMSFDTESRSVAWQIETGDFSPAVAFASGVIYAIDSGVLVAIDSRDGGEMWRYSAPDALQAPAVVTANHVFVSSFLETIAVDRRTGMAVWKTPKAGQLAIDAYGTLYISGFFGEVSAFREGSDRDGDGIPDGWEDFYGLDADDPNDALLDPDSDGLTNLEEFRANTDPGNADSDSDGLSDYDELHLHLTDPNLFDTDNDGIDDYDELTITSTDPNNADSDGDGLSDGDEVNNYFSNPNDVDTDGDGVSDFAEIRTGSNALDAMSLPRPLGTYIESFEGGGVLPQGWSVPIDAHHGWQVTAGDSSDGDFRLESDNSNYPTFAVIEFTGFLSEGYVKFDAKVVHGCCEFNRLRFHIDGETKANLADASWRDVQYYFSPGLHTFRWEFVVTATSPNITPKGFIDSLKIVADRDRDTMSDEWEELYGLDPDDPDDGAGDLDNDSLNNVQEFLSGTLPNDPDTDDDGMPDGWEVQNGLDPIDPSDASEDPDNDGLDNIDEFARSLNPNYHDSDNDGMPDGWEVDNGLDPGRNDAAADPDGDGVSNLNEFLAGTNPRDPPPPAPPPGKSGGGGGGAAHPALLLLMLLIFGRRARVARNERRLAR